MFVVKRHNHATHLRMYTVSKKSAHLTTGLNYVIQIFDYSSTDCGTLGQKMVNLNWWDWLYIYLYDYVCQLNIFAHDSSNFIRETVYGSKKQWLQWMLEMTPLYFHTCLWYAFNWHIFYQCLFFFAECHIYRHCSDICTIIYVFLMPYYKNYISKNKVM